MSVRYLMDRYRPAREKAGRPELTIHHLRHTAITIDRDKALAEKIGQTYDARRDSRKLE